MPAMISLTRPVGLTLGTALPVLAFAAFTSLSAGRVEAQSAPAPARSGTQARPAAAPAPRPASAAEVEAYSLQAAVTICELAVRSKVGLELTLPATSQSVAFLINRRHGGQIEGISGKLSAQQLYNGSAVQIISLVKQGCYDKLPAQDRKRVDDAIRQIQTAPPPARK
jgi:hypothetical protein